MMLQLKSERGESLIGIMASLLLSSVVMAAAVTNFTDAWRRSSDLRMMAQTQTEARTLLDLLAYDFRMIGSGMPLGQAGFQVGDTALGTSTLPILTTSTATNVVARLNQTGSNTVLTASYTPSSSSLQTTVLSAAPFSVGQTVYLSNVTTGGTSGMMAVLSAASGTSLSFTSSYSATSGAVFPAGSLVEPVWTVTYSSPTTGTGVTRNSGSGAVVLSPRSTFSVSYLTSAGTALTLPLTDTIIRTSLAALNVSATVTSSRKLLNGKNYIATTQQVVALRNLNLSR